MNITEWGISIVLDFFWGGMAVGTFLFSVLYKKKNHQASRIAAFASPFCLFFAMIFLVTHLGRPLNTFWVIFSFNFSSVIAWGSLLQGILLIISIAYAFTVYKNSKNMAEPEDSVVTSGGKSMENKLGIIGIPFAVLVGIYHGYLLMSLSGRPLWNSGLMPVLSVGAFITTGLALVILVTRFLSKGKDKDSDLNHPYTILIAALVVQFFAVLMWLNSLWFGGVQNKDAVFKLVSENVFSFWIMAISIGLIVPIIVGIKDLINMKKNGIQKHTSPKILLLFVLVGAFFLRYVIIMAGQ